MHVDAWHFLKKNRRLQFGDDRRVVTAGTVLRTDEPIELCKWGFHGSTKLTDAITYSPGPVLCRTCHSGEIIHGDDKLVSSVREVLWMVDAFPIVRKFACLQALSVSHLWDMPEVVRRYLQTQDPTLLASAKVAWGVSGSNAAAAAAWAIIRSNEWHSAVWAARNAMVDAASAARDAGERSLTWDDMNIQLEHMAWAHYREQGSLDETT